MAYPTFFIPGFHGSGPTHWQSRAQAQLDNSSTLHSVDWEFPDITAWADQVHRQLAALEAPALLVAHSFGCLVAASVVAERPQSVTGVVFVAPANPQRFLAIGGLNLREQVRGKPAPTVADILPETLPASVRSVVIASEDDPWLSFSAALELKERWSSHFVDLGEVGHINVDSGFGPWPALVAQLKSLREQHIPDFRTLDRDNLANSNKSTAPVEQLRPRERPRYAELRFAS